MDDAQWRYFEQRYPGIRRNSGTPGLWRINGVGTTMLGRHDPDAQSRAYVKTQVFTVLFVPLLALASYVVVDAQRGWYFLGRVPMQPWLRLWNKLLAGALAAVLLGGMGWDYLQSPGFQMSRRLAQAERQEQRGELADAAQGYAEVLASNTGSAAEARTHLEGLLARPADDSRPPLLRLAFRLKLRHQAFQRQDLLKQGTDDAAAVQARDPRLALHILDVLAEQPGQADGLAAQRQALLEATVKAHPDDVDAASRLALWHEQRGELQQAAALLMPLKDRLGASEGARLLGRILAHSGQPEQAYQLLQPYTQQHLQALHQAEAAYSADEKRVWDSTIEALNRGVGPADFFSRYKAASDADKKALVQQYVAGRIAADGSVAAHRAQLVEAARIVPVALDLGMVTLYRAREMKDPQQREHTLNEAKQTFLAVNSVAGDSDQYRLYLGQTYYWLGQAAEGEKLFDELLAANKRPPELLLTVSSALREVGAMAPARKLAEEAYAKGDTQQKYAAAQMRALMYKDHDDQLAWLKRADPANPSVVASLSSAAADTALLENRPAESLRLRLRAAEAYEKLPESAATLNNAANEYFDAYAISGDKAHRAKALEKFSQAVALQPGDAILLNNSAQTLAAAAAEDVIAGRFDPGRLQQRAQVYLLYYLATSPAERGQLGQALLADANTAEAIRDFEKLAVLRPKSADSYETLMSIYHFTGNAEALTKLHRQVAEAQVDSEDAVAEARAELRGERDARDAERSAKAAAFLRDHLARLGGPQDRVTRAIAQVSLANTLIQVSIAGGKADVAEALAMAESAQRELPARPTYLALAGACFLKGLHGLAAANPAFAAWLPERLHRLGPATALGLALDNPAFKAALLGNADVRRGIDAVAASWQRLHQPNGLDWKLLDAAGYGAAQEIAAAMRPGSSEEEALQIERLLEPASQGVALQAIWSAESRGDHDAAAAVARQLQALGVGLPAT